jgi:hypothetical protein
LEQTGEGIMGGGILPFWNTSSGLGAGENFSGGNEKADMIKVVALW